MEDCLICNRIRLIKEGTNKYFAAELETGYVVIGDHQYFEGYTLFLCKEYRNELHELDQTFKEKFLVEMSKVSEAVYNAFNPIKLNYELLVMANHICTGISSQEGCPNPLQTSCLVDS